MAGNKKLFVRQAFVLVAVVTVVSVGAVGGVTAQESVTGCGIIDSSGNYVLEGDISEDADSCIEITSSDVSFDGQGNSITGVGDENSTAITVRGEPAGAVKNVEVTNVDINDWGEGVRLSVVNESEVSEVDVTRTENTAITLTESSHNTVVDNTLDENEEGISVDTFFIAATDNTVEDNTVENTNGTAVALVFGAQGNTVRRNTVRNNEFGIANIFFSAENTVTENTVTENDVGVVSAIGAENVVSNNEITDNVAGVSGLLSFGETIENNRINNNDEAGIVLLNSFGTDIVDNELRDNQRDFTEIFVPDAEDEAEDEFNFGDDAVDEILDGQEENVIERTELGSSGTETVLSFNSNNVTVSGLDPATVPAPPSDADGTGLYFEAEDGFDTEEFEGDLDEIDGGVDEGQVGEFEQLRSSFLDVDVHYDGAGVTDENESDLTLRRHDGRAWTEASSTVDTQEDAVSANLTEFGTFGVFVEGEKGDDDSGVGSGGISPDNPFGDANNEPLGISDAADVLFEWNQKNGTVNGENIPISDMADFLFEWNQAQ
jgi:parallel beta-helix repeat protein